MVITHLEFAMTEFNRVRSILARDSNFISQYFALVMFELACRVRTGLVSECVISCGFVKE